MTNNTPRRGRPPKNSWFNPRAAEFRLLELERSFDALIAERELLQSILGGGPVLNGPAEKPAGRAPVSRVRRSGRRGRGGRSSMLDIIETVMRRSKPGSAWSVGDLRDELHKVAPERVSAANASALISSALVQSLRAKTPRFKGGRGGRGRARKYRLVGSGPAQDVRTPFVRGPGVGRPKGRPGRKGTLTAQVIAFLDGKKGQSLMPKEIAEGLGLADKRKKTLSTTLFVLAKKKRIKKAAKGYRSAS
jgi:hypothetical protein